MPASVKSSRAFRTTSFSGRIPTAVRIGAELLVIGAGLALCATMQMEQAAASLAVGCVWTHSAAAIHNIRDRQSHAVDRTQVRISRPSELNSRLGIRLPTD